MTHAGFLAVGLALLATGCASRLDQADELYRDGALHEAVEIWRSIPEDSAEATRARERLAVVEPQLDRMLRRFEKQAAFYEAEGRLSEAVLYYRLAVKLDPRRAATLQHVQALARELRRRAAELRSSMRGSLQRSDLVEASRRADELLALNPLDPAVQIDVREVRRAIAAEIAREMQHGTSAWTSGDLVTARAAFENVRALDTGNEEALGYLAYIEAAEQQAVQRTEAARPAPREAPTARALLAEGHFAKGRNAERNGQPFRAIESYELALRTDPNHAQARTRLARLREALASRVPELYADGNRYFQDEDLHNALKSWNQVLLIQPEHPQATENAARAKRILERLEEIQSGS